MSTSVIAEIEALISDAAAGPEAPYLETVERTLTDGYARALALEAEQLRLERRLGDVAAGIAEGDRDAVEEISSISTRLRDATRELRELRRILVPLRTLAAELRTA